MEMRPLQPKKAAFGTPERRHSQLRWSILEGKIHPSTRHAEVVLRTVNKVPTEITDPADVRREANFEAAADLAKRLGRAAGVKMSENVTLGLKCFTVRKRIPFTAAKDRAATTKNVGRKTRAVERITQRQRAEGGTHRARRMAARGEEKLPCLTFKPLVLKFPEIQDTSSGTRRPTFDTNTEVTVEKVFDIPTTAPSVVGLDVAVVLPIVSGKNISAPKSHVKLIIRVPLRARGWGCHLLHLLSGIGLSTGERQRADRRDPQQGQHQFPHLISPFG